MEPSASEFLRLNEFAGCPASRNNADISKLLYLMENGFKRDIINDPDFGYRNVFQEYVTRIDDCINGQSSYQICQMCWMTCVGKRRISF